MLIDTLQIYVASSLRSLPFFLVSLPSSFALVQDFDIGYTKWNWYDIQIQSIYKYIMKYKYIEGEGWESFKRDTYVRCVECSVSEDKFKEINNCSYL